MTNHTVQPHREPNAWAIGFTGFAAFMMILIGFFHVVAGIAGIGENTIYGVTDNYVFAFDVTTWGWIHLIAGVVVMLAGFWLFTGAVWARTIAVILAALSIIANFVFLPYYPLWSILMIAVAVAVIWALTAHGRDVTEV
jgi:hypothetical protein